MADKTTDGTGALEKALDVLDAVGRAPAGLSQVELAGQLALPRTTLYRLLGSLSARGLLRRDPLRRVYCLGPRCFEYARAAYTMPDLVAAAGAELRALRDMTGETTYLATLDGLEVLSLERCDGAHSQRSSSDPGERKPLHCTSQGKAILAALPPAQRDALVAELPMPACTPRTLTDRRRLLAELKLTATRGWSIDDEEISLGVRCCGAAIVDAAGQVRGAISVAGPAFRLTMERVELLGPEVADAARRIGAQIAPAAAPVREGGAVHPVPGDWAFEGAMPVWSAADGLLYWADTLAPSIHAATAAGDRIVARLDAPVEALVALDGGVAALVGRAWVEVRADGTVRPWPDGPRRRLTAAVRAPDGALWACAADGDHWRVSALTTEGQPSGGWRLPEPATALAWQPDGEQIVMAAAGSGALYTARRGSGLVQRLATVPKGSGTLAGLAVEPQGGVWAALRGGWTVVRFEVDGSVDRVLPVPVPFPTGLAFGGPDGRQLFVTSARNAVRRDALEAAPWSGRLFVTEPSPGAEPG
jgi:DNA-binding IclR family transcriptional regulator/sugar lactone lactonase YvrE